VAFQSLPGFRDVFPADMAVRQHITTAWRSIAQRYGFEEYDGPPLESLELYVAKSGEEIVGQLYAFTDKGQREVAMRPEMTPTLARMIVAKGPSLRKPIKWFAIPQLFRYEKPQKGRLREHWQFNMDILGEADVSADAELMAAAIDTLRVFGLGPVDFVARFSDRRLLSAILLQMDADEEQIPAVYAVIDKWERQPLAVSVEKLTAIGLSQLAIEALQSTMRLHQENPSIQGQLQAFEALCFDHKWFDPGVTEAVDRIKRYVDILDGYGLADFLRLDLTIVRGLAYYTGIVFELFDAKGELRAIAGGGRYDKLIETLGGDPMPALGFGMGDVVLAELLRQRGLMPEYKRTCDAYLVQVGPEVEPIVLQLAHRLRDQGRSVERSFHLQGVGKQLKTAAAMGAATTYIVGPDEVFGSGEIVARDMAAGTESRMRLADLIGEAEAQTLIERCRPASPQ
jgi:histidyl-tRNA synthetase